MARARGLEIPGPVASYLLTHAPRGVGDLRDAVDRIDRGDVGRAPARHGTVRETGARTLMSAEARRVVFTGGGSAGHVVPNLPVIAALQEAGWAVDLSRRRRAEASLVQAQGVDFRRLPAGKLRPVLLAGKSPRRVSNAGWCLEGVFRAAQAEPGSGFLQGWLCRLSGGGGGLAEPHTGGYATSRI